MGSRDQGSRFHLATIWHHEGSIEDFEPREGIVEKFVS